MTQSARSRSGSRDRGGRVFLGASGGGGGGGGGVGGPTERSATHGSLTSSSNTISLPTGTVAGDLLTLPWGSDYQRSGTLTGWNIPVTDYSSFFQGGLAWKIATAADVTAGSFNFALGGAANGHYSIVSTQQGTFDPFTPIRVSSHIQKAAGTATMPQAMDTFTTLALSRSYYFAARSAQGQTLSCSVGAMQWQNNSAAAANGYYNAAALYAEDITAAASRTPTWTGAPTVTDVDGAAYVQYEVRPAVSGTKNRTNYAAAVLANSPWGFWQQAETSGATLADSSGNSRTMTVTGSPTLAVAGPFTDATAVRYPDGTVNGDTYAVTTATSTSSAATMECWVLVPSGTLPNASAVMGMATSYNSTTWDKELYLDSDGVLRFEAFNGANQIITASGALTRDVWHHVVASVGAAGMKLRVDKTTVASNSGVTTSYTGAQVLVLHGGGSAQSGKPIMGIAAPAFFTSQLSDAQTDAHYDAA